MSSHSSGRMIARFITVSCLAILCAACSRSSDHTAAAKAAAQPAGAGGTLPANLLTKHVQMELELLSALMDSIQGGGGYQEWTPEKAADKLVEIAGSASAPVPEEGGAQQTSKPRFTYVRNQVTGPWQIVIKVDDDQKGLVAAAYGMDTATPLATKAIPVSRF